MAIKAFKYAGIGPRNITGSVGEGLAHVAFQMAMMGWILRSGNAPGSDQSWQSGAGQLREIYLPWAHYECDGQPQGFHISPLSEQIEVVARTSLGPSHWGNLKAGGRKLMMRNVSIILGPELDDPVLFAAYWHPKIQPDGGTGNAIKLAQANGIPTFNINFARDQEAMSAFIEACTTT